MGCDRDLKSKRLQEAENFLKSESLNEIISKHGLSKDTEELLYSNTLEQLQDIVLNMTKSDSLF